MAFKYIDNTSRVKSQVRQGAGVFVKLVAEDIVRTARPKTPLKEGNLRDDITVKGLGTQATITWHQPYATYQERGKRADGSHIVKNYSAAGTGKHFAENAVKKVINNIDTYVIKAMRIA